MRRRRCERRRCEGRRAQDDRGSATVWVVFACAALCAVFLALLAVAQAVQARHRAGAAADLAALAASDEALLGRAEACATARRVAHRSASRGLGSVSGRYAVLCG
ncbi:hypothetical protein SRB5_51220 [Streptomyces sp. RB5]|uniref:Putative Flp pilus-assembly TadG-like N-terminal domain-containing protein n=1 Tax=Streptomyces smaragdinus TaxID=2585196 RepID=A0A7K0CN83_9ACTN|nr:hypothetical protein [Streptomyces smaragdinus]